MGNREQGSTALTAMAAVAALGLASFYVNNAVSKNTAMRQEVQASRAQEDDRIATFSVLSKLKGMMAERKVGSNYIPGIFARNYFEANWDLKNRVTPNDPKRISPANGQIVNMDALTVKTVDKANQVMAGTKQIDAGSQPLTITLDPVKFTGPLSAMVESVDVTVTGEVVSPDGKTKKKVTNRARVKLPTPKPRSPVLEAAKDGTEDWKPIAQQASQMQNGGKWKMRAKASGVVFAARIYDNGTEAAKFGGWGLNGKVNHSAVSYDSVDAIIGQTTVDLGGKAESEGGGDLKNCSFVPPTAAVGQKHKYQLEIEAIDGTRDVKTPEVEVQIASEAVGLGPDPTIDEIRTSCTNSCRFIEDDTDASKISAEAVANHDGDMSSIWTWAEGLSVRADGSPGYNVGHRKLCINFDKAENRGHNFGNASWFVYDLPSCKRGFIGKRAACGCVTGDSLVLMGDGKTEKRISELQEGDSAWNPITRKSYPIRHVTQGPEKGKPMLAIQAGSQTIRATGNHPFLLTNGRTVKAMELKAGDVLKGAGEKSLPIASIKAEQPGDNAPIVWNLELEAPNEDLDTHNVQINGIVTGDLLIQKMLQSGVASN